MKTLYEVKWHQTREARTGRYLHAVTIRAGRKAKTVVFDLGAESQEKAGDFFWNACEWMREKAAAEAKSRG